MFYFEGKYVGEIKQLYYQFLATEWLNLRNCGNVETSYSK